MNSISDYLENEGYHVETVSTFAEATEKVNLYSYECILVDIGLPDGNGLDVISELKKSRKLSGVIIISAKV